ncbi:hypothetical Protein YC6258_04169 [Gynuella sunshinyii YC6258]|uniref:Uncharacterized protein n=1 Tax=Gynuella sunshinyii YC6258 TaxID=1445510 RepID=A0A0C5VA39_9GAMM|nr:hypothetical Protein YC6258_04169 [Gynuella sunshinyii YC6258]
MLYLDGMQESRNESSKEDAVTCIAVSVNNDCRYLSKNSERQYA